MLILALDCCGPACAAGVWQDGAILARARESMQRGQDARLLPMVVETIARSGHSFSDLNRIAVTRGPGSFTGLRVGLAAAIGIGLAADRPVIGIDRFSVYRSLHGNEARNLLVIIDSKRAELFCRFYPAASAAPVACMLTNDQIAGFLASHPDTLVAGDQATPDDDIVAACARLAALADPQKDEYRPRPLYLRAPDVTMAPAILR